MVRQMDLLGEIASRCLIRQGLTEDQMVLLAAVLRKVVSGQCRTIGEALGLQSARGGMPYWLEYAVRRRNFALARLAQIHFAGLSASDQARRIAALSTRYAATAWQFDQRREAMPEQYVGTAREWLWRAFASGARMPIAHRQLRTILSTAGVTRTVDRRVLGGLQDPAASPSWPAVPDRLRHEVDAFAKPDLLQSPSNPSDDEVVI